MVDVVHCTACGARLRDTFADLCPTCRADLAVAGVRQERASWAVGRVLLALVGVVVLMVLPRLFRFWVGG
jgi:hypothetical protein